MCWCSAPTMAAKITGFGSRTGALCRWVRWAPIACTRFAEVDILRPMRQAILLLLSGFSCAHLALAVSLQDYANGRPLTVYTVKSGSKVPCGPDDQTNNFKEFDKVLLLSGKGL